VIAVDPWQAAKLAGVGLIASLLIFGGCQWQGKLDRAEIKGLETAIAERNTALRAAAASLTGASNAIRAVNAQAEANVLAAMEQARRGSAAAAEARRDAERTAERVESLERKLQQERSTCTEGQARICGVPLR
jgi:chromosome segregation ATPase